MASIARDSAAGISTLHRNYPTREAILATLAEHAGIDRVLDRDRNDPITEA